MSLEPDTTTEECSSRLQPDPVWNGYASVAVGTGGYMFVSVVAEWLHECTGGDLSGYGPTKAAVIDGGDLFGRSR
jgi:hypothetical protein